MSQPDDKGMKTENNTKENLDAVVSAMREAAAKKAAELGMDYDDGDDGRAYFDMAGGGTMFVDVVAAKGNGD